MLQTGKSEEAVALTSEKSPTEVYPSWKGEYLATRAMALAATGKPNTAAEPRVEALNISRMAEVQMLAIAANSIADATRRKH